MILVTYMKRACSLFIYCKYYQDYYSSISVFIFIYGMNTKYQKILLWIKRYWPWEFWWTLGAMIWWYSASLLGGNEVVIWYSGAWWENVGYYWYFLWKEYREQRYLYLKKVSFFSLCKGVMSEFGIPEILDSTLIRPLTMWTWSKLWWIWWLLLWKFLADAIFYLPATILYYRKTKKSIDNNLMTLTKKIDDLV